MAAENVITIVGNCTDDPELRYTPNGVPVANVRVAVNRRIRNTQTNDWEDRLDGYFTVNVWRDMAENAAETLKRGTRVLVQGRLISRSYEDKEGQTRWVTEIEADEICPSLRWAKATIEKVVRQRGNGQGSQNSRDQGSRDQGSSDGSWQGAPAPSKAPEPDEVPF